MLYYTVIQQQQTHNNNRARVMVEDEKLKMTANYIQHNMKG